MKNFYETIAQILSIYFTTREKFPFLTIRSANINRIESNLFPTFRNIKFPSQILSTRSTPNARKLPRKFLEIPRVLSTLFPSITISRNFLLTTRIECKHRKNQRVRIQAKITRQCSKVILNF